LFKLDDPDEAAEIKLLVQRHVQLTGSELAECLLGDWNNTLAQFVKVFPSEYRRVLEETEKEKSGAAAQASA